MGTFLLLWRTVFVEGLRLVSADMHFLRIHYSVTLKKPSFDYSNDVDCLNN